MRMFVVLAALRKPKPGIGAMTRPGPADNLRHSTPFRLPRTRFHPPGGSAQRATKQNAANRVLGGLRRGFAARLSRNWTIGGF
jgi:hypothetical protein